MRRKRGYLSVLEAHTLQAVHAMERENDGLVHGYALAFVIPDFLLGLGAGRMPGARPRLDGRAARTCLHRASVYRALSRLEALGLVEGAWEHPDTALQARRPRRRYYRLTPEGHRARSPAMSGGRVLERPPPGARPGAATSPQLENTAGWRITRTRPYPGHSSIR